MIVAATTLVVKPYRARKRLASGEERSYITYRITLPKDFAEKLGLKDDAEDLLLALLVKPRWFHLFDWSNPEVVEEVLPRLTEDEKRILCATLAPESVCGRAKPHILIADPEELRELGLDPDKPLTLEDLLKTLEKKLATTKT